MPESKNRPFLKAEAFIAEQARLLDQRLFASCYLGEDPSGVVEALRGYRNSDGGFGHGLEPDKRCPASLPVDIEVALHCLYRAGAAAEEMVWRACDFLLATCERLGTSGPVPLSFSIIERYPRASHWSEWTYEPGLNPTAGIAGLLYALGVEHPWRERAAKYCWSRLESGEPITSAHDALEALAFLEHVPDETRARAASRAIAAQLPIIDMVHLEPNQPGYGLSPLKFAPRADSRARALFDDERLDAHLDQLMNEQQGDGGWGITWEPPSNASTLEWRGIVTFEAISTLVSYGRVEVASPSS